MKRILLALALILAVQVADAQATADAARKSIDKATEATLNPKKSGKVATWLALGKAYRGAYNQPTAQVVKNVSKTYLNEMMTEKPSSEVSVVVSDTPMTKQIYSDKELYFDGNGNLVMIYVTKFPVEDPLYKAFEAYMKAQELDVEGSKTKDIIAALEEISKNYVTDAETDFHLGDFMGSSIKFEKAAEVAAAAPLSRPDGMCISNAALAAHRVPDLARARGLYEKAIQMGYYDEGNVFLRLSVVCNELGDKAAQRAALEEAVEKLPENKDALTYLIDFYLQNDEDPAKLFDLTAKAIAQNPTAAYPYYAQGTLYDKLAQSDLAKAEEYIALGAASFDKAAEVEPAYVFSYVGKGQMYCKRADELNSQASAEMDDAKWRALVDKANEAIEAAIAPLEKVYELSDQEQNKIWAATLLKECYYRVREKNPEYEAAYNKYNEIVKANR